MVSHFGEQLEQMSWFIGISLFLVFAVIETLQPDRRQGMRLTTRWIKQLALYGLCLTTVGLAAPGELAHRLLGTDYEQRFLFAGIGRMGGEWAIVITGCLLIDLYAYAMHRVEHRVFLLWRFHSVHHADTELDVSTTLRHHPVEFLLNGIWQAFLFAVLGLPAWAFPIYAAFSLCMGYFQHSNIRIPPGLEDAARLLFVTPGMHRAHHSTDPRCFDSNYGNVLSIWDRLFGTYRPLRAHEFPALTYGVPAFTAPVYARFRWSLMLPFAIRRRTQESES